MDETFKSSNGRSKIIFQTWIRFLEVTIDDDIWNFKSKSLRVNWYNSSKILDLEVSKTQNFKLNPIQ